MFVTKAKTAMNPPDPSDGEAEDPQAQQIDLDDADVSAVPSMPPLPPMPPPVSMAPAAPSRSPMFYVGVLVGVLVLSAAVGTVVAMSRRRAPTPTAATPTATGATAPKVITIGTVEMDDNPDGGP